MTFHALKGHEGWVWQVLLNKSASRLYSCSSDSTIRIWDTNSLNCIATLKGHTQAVSCIALCPSEKYLASGSWDTTVKVWDLATEKCLFTLSGHTAWIQSIDFPETIAPKKGKIISCASDMTIRIWNLAKTSQKPKICKGHTDEVYCVSSSPDGSFFYSCASNGEARIWKMKGSKKKAWLAHPHEVKCIFANSSGDKIYTCGGDGEIKCWDHNSHCLGTFQGHSKEVRSAIFPKNNDSVLFSCSNDATVRLWDAKTFECIRILELYNAETTEQQREKLKSFSIAVSPDKNKIYVGTGDYEFGVLKMFDLNKVPVKKTTTPALSGSSAICGVGRRSIAPESTSTSTTESTPLGMESAMTSENTFVEPNSNVTTLPPQTTTTTTTTTTSSPPVDPMSFATTTNTIPLDLFAPQTTMLPTSATPDTPEMPSNPANIASPADNNPSSDSGSSPASQPGANSDPSLGNLISF